MENQGCAEDARDDIDQLKYRYGTNRDTKRVQALVNTVAQWRVQQVIRVEKSRERQTALGYFFDIEREQDSIPVVGSRQETQINSGKTDCERKQFTQLDALL